VRPWLVILGSAIAIIGGGLIITLFLFSSGPTTTTLLNFDNPAVGPHTDWPEAFTRSTAVPGSVGLSWNSSAPATVTLTPAVLCDTPLGVCPDGPPVLSWTSATSGEGTVSSANASAYILDVENPSNATLRFTASVTVSYHPGPPLSTWAWGLIALGGITLLGIGGVAVFLGLFLPGGVYDEIDEADLHLPPSEPPETPSP